MYTEESPIILEKIKAEKLWFRSQLDNWDKIVQWIEIIPEPPLRFLNLGVMDITVLQQKYTCIVHFTERQSFGNPEWDYDRKVFSYWLNVPTEELKDDSFR